MASYRLRDFIFHPRAACRVRANQDHCDRRILKMAEDHPPGGIFARFVGLYVLGLVKETGNVRSSNHIHVPNLVGSPDVVLVMEAEKHSSCHLKSFPYADLPKSLSF